MFLHQANLPARSGYIVHPIPAPTIDDARKRRNEGGRSQKLMLLIPGNAILRAPIISGTSSQILLVLL